MAGKMPAPFSMFELFEHTADLGLRIRAATLAELLAEAGRGLLSILVANPEAVRPVQTKTIQLSAEEPSYLLFDWLSELLFAFENEKLLVTEFAIDLECGAALQLTATCRGESMDQSRHQMDHEVKAITYHHLHVDQTKDGWEAEVIVDI
jgi:SHS2 domain-containing protein